ncbi:SUF system NifU family Fe-S cluster assembly protein [soil metagenome]
MTELSANIQAMYQELILDHYRRPRNKGTLESPDRSIPMRNPLCGDEIDLHVKLDGDRVTDLRFTGRGCSISQAAASMMTEAVKGKTTAEATALWDRYHAMILGDEAAATDKSLGPLRSLSGVSKFPARVRCALLAWNALEEAIGKKTG